MKELPPVLCEMDMFEALQFSQQIMTLPENFSHMKSLKKVDFHGAFNNNTSSPVDLFIGIDPNLKPIIAVIGQLPTCDGFEKITKLEN